MNVYLLNVDMNAHGIKDAGLHGVSGVEALFAARPENMHVYMLDSARSTAIYVRDMSAARLGFLFANSGGQDCSRQFLYVGDAVHGEAVDRSTEAELRYLLRIVDPT